MYGLISEHCVPCISARETSQRCPHVSAQLCERSSEGLHPLLLKHGDDWGQLEVNCCNSSCEHLSGGRSIFMNSEVKKGPLGLSSPTLMGYFRHLYENSKVPDCLVGYIG